MKSADAIRKHGFRKWYERELLQCHGHLVLTFLCMIGIFAAVEAMGHRGSWADQAVNLLSIGLCTAVGVWALRRYLYLLNHAEMMANQADCPHCQAYGRFVVESQDEHERTLQVCCRKCQHRWTISD
jgi:ABC-type nickel/cobalt efflux system permease component RcnA